MILPGAALATLALTVSACASGTSGGTSGQPAGAAGIGANTAAVSSGGDSPGTAVTAAQARQVFTGYVSATASALARGDKRAALAPTTGVQAFTVTSQFLEAAYAHAKPPTYRYGTPVFYRPAVASYPRWFVASVSRTASAAPVPAAVAGVTLSARGQVLMVFTQADPGSPWLLASSAQLAPGQSLPRLATSSDGDAVAAPVNDATTLAQPQVTGPLQAAVVADGPASTATRAVAAGPLTTGIYAYQNAPAPGQAAPPGDIREWALDGTHDGTFALRTADGGALVFYVMYLDTIIEVPTKLNDASPLVPGPPISIPAEFAPLLSANRPSPKYDLTTQLALAFAAVDPPSAATGEKISVIAVGGGPSWASAS